MKKLAAVVLGVVLSLGVWGEAGGSHQPGGDITFSRVIDSTYADPDGSGRSLTKRTFRVRCEGIGRIATVHVAVVREGSGLAVTLETEKTSRWERCQ